jgi:4-hydroxy-4-methyl-2-oxoglutarate aldolase
MNAASPAKTLKLRSSDVSDAMDRIGISGVLTGFYPVHLGGPVAGPAMTVLIQRNEQASKGVREGLVDSMMMSPLGSILVIRSESYEYSVWGGFLSRFAASKGVKGVVVDGASRDSEEIRELGFPVYTRALSPASGYGRLAVSSAGRPIRIGSVSIVLGDLVVADHDGVVIIPKANVSRVVRQVQNTLKAESKRPPKLPNACPPKPQSVK